MLLRLLLKSTWLENKQPLQLFLDPVDFAVFPWKCVQRSQGHTKLQFPSGEFQSFAFPCLQGKTPAWKGKNISGSYGNYRRKKWIQTYLFLMGMLEWPSNTGFPALHQFFAKHWNGWSPTSCQHVMWVLFFVDCGALSFCWCLRGGYGLPTRPQWEPTRAQVVGNLPTRPTRVWFC